MAPVVDVPSTHGENAGDYDKNIDEQKDEIEIVQCVHSLRFCKNRASPMNTGCTASIAVWVKPVANGYQ
jgi:hypothetical protein